METKKTTSGRLKIYFSYAQEVDKMLPLLIDAKLLAEKGKKVVIGALSSADLYQQLVLDDIPWISSTAEGLPIAAILSEQPEIVVIENLAFLNPNSVRNQYRYQDIQELLLSGVDVFTTLDVGELESLRPIISQLQHHAPQTIPDFLFDEADQIEFVDMAPEGSLHPDQDAATFEVKEKRQHLDALRALALRKVTDHISKKTAPTILRAPEHVLVCLSPSPSNQQVIRSAARIAKAIEAKFSALYVDASKDKQQPGLNENIRLAEALGAKVTILYEEDVANQIMAYAKVSHVTKIVIGKSSRINQRRQNRIEKLVEYASDIDIFIIPTAQVKKNRIEKLLPSPVFSWRDTCTTVAILIICALIGWVFHEVHIDDANIITIFILGVQVNAILTKGYFYSVVSSILSVLVFNFLFIEPIFALEWVRSGYPITFIIMLIAALITSSLTKRIKNQGHKNAQKAYRTEVLLETNQKLQQTDNRSAVLQETAQYLKKLVQRSIVYYPVIDNVLQEPHVLPISDDAQSVADYLQLEEESIVRWVTKYRKEGGAATSVFTKAKYTYFPVHNYQDIYAVIGIEMEEELEFFEKSIVLSILGECALAIEKAQLRSEQQEAASTIEKEHLRSNLLRAISHDLRTPLTSISGNAKLLIEDHAVLTELQQRAAIVNIYEDSLWLNHLVENVLAMTKIENDTLALHLETHVIDDIVYEAIQHIDPQIEQHQLALALSDDILAAKMDPHLMSQVLVNFLNNAIKYTQKSSVITIKTERKQDALFVSVIDNGPGVPKTELGNIFQQFYTAENIVSDGRRGLGLGLSLCKSIVEAHQGQIFAAQNKPTGLIVGFQLPIVEVSLNE
ncbi:DUF4118 domain-containing protein [Enterococcus sp. DIV0876]|uniref:DUF4118 domain-containing protein n=1 Tax=Enterococcus sp. DIV0876 TaxID=2774633 RepID=UPI003D2FD925